MEQLEFWYKKYSKEELGYLAGMLDGEGTIMISKRRERAFLKVAIGNTNQDVINYLHARFGGSTERTEDHRHEHWKPMHRVYWCGNYAIKILNLIYEYLIIKRIQADIAFEFAETIKEKGGRGNKLTQEEIQKREELKSKISLVNRGG